GETYWTPACASTSECVFPGGIIPKAAFSNVSGNLLSMIPFSSNPDPGVVAQGFDDFRSALPQRLRDDKGAIRVDANSRFGTISAYYFMDDFTLNSPVPSDIGANVPGFGASNIGRAQLASLGNTKTFGPTAVNEFHLSYTRSAAHFGQPTQGVAPGTLANLGFTAPATVGGVFNGGIAPIAPALEGVPSVSFAGTLGATFGVPSITTGQFNNTYQVQDNFTK